MPTMHHPTIESVTVDVSPDDVAEWRDQGWKAPGVADDRPKSKKD